MLRSLVSRHLLQTESLTGAPIYRTKNTNGTLIMKTTTLNSLAMALLPIALWVTSSGTTVAQDPAADATTAVAVEEGVPGGIAVNTTTISAKVTAIDQESRELTLVGPKGNELTVTVGPEAVNFDQIEVGDMVNATVTEQLVVALGDPSASAGDGSALTVALAPKGAQPGGVVAEVTQVTGTVVVLDALSRTATLLFDDGSTQVFPVRDDIDLTQRRLGEQVVFQVTQMLAIDVTKSD